MSIVIHHGHPGSYKSFGVLQRHAIPALLEGRTVVTNIRGFDSVEKVEQAIDEVLPSEARILNVNTEGRDEKHYMACWFHWAPKGALVIIDEAQAIYPAKRKDFRIENLDYPGGEDKAAADERPADMMVAYDMHRHYNWDVFLCTPHISKVHAEIRQAAQVAFRHYSMGELVPWKKDKWREIEHDPENNGKSKSHAYGVPKEYKADVSLFDTYQSTKTGDHQSNQGPQSVFKDKRVVGYLSLSVFSVLAFVVLAVNIFQRDRSYSLPDPTDIQSIDPVFSDAGSNGRDVRRSEARPEVSSGISWHPFTDVRLDIAGSINRRYVFHGSDDLGEFSVTQKDIFSFGYRVLYVTDCHGQLWWNGEKVQDIYCQRNRIEQPDLRPDSNPIGLSNPFLSVNKKAERADGRDDGEERTGARGAF
ncbi:zonular occludens toxin family protein [Marinobacter sp. KMM 10035]|uniref:zonular occludens toxin family protein n=1 Tax=Marinobacter sp. KMM 10035 TaxID=3134034 RepID=UPI00397BCC0F